MACRSRGPRKFEEMFRTRRTLLLARAAAGPRAAPSPPLRRFVSSSSNLLRCVLRARATHSFGAMRGSSSGSGMAYVEKSSSVSDGSSRARRCTIHTIQVPRCGGLGPRGRPANGSGMLASSCRLLVHEMRPASARSMVPSARAPKWRAWLDSAGAPSPASAAPAAALAGACALPMAPSTPGCGQGSASAAAAWLPGRSVRGAAEARRCTVLPKRAARASTPAAAQPSSAQPSEAPSLSQARAASTGFQAPEGSSTFWPWPSPSQPLVVVSPWQPLAASAALQASGANSAFRPSTDTPARTCSSTSAQGLSTAPRRASPSQSLAASTGIQAPGTRSAF
mmetsp:Transcript_12762/g.35945  ORF Transcript_12762/g.35945 Transcript_12762/m.35945 type:complete len:338 (+) Transcript_12762:457-1470(+)